MWGFQRSVLAVFAVVCASSAVPTSVASGAADPASVFEWVHQFGSAGSDAGLATTVDAAGNVYVTGGASGSIAGAPEPIAGDYSDAVVASYDSAGRSRWVHLLGSTGSDVGIGIAADSFGNVYVVGSTGGTLAGSPEPIMGDYDAFIASYTREGVRRWVHQLGTVDDETGAGIAVDTAGNVFVTGTTGGSLPGSTELNAGDLDAFIASYDNAGNRRWVHQLGGRSFDWSRAVTVDPSGVVTLTGRTSGTLPDVTDPRTGAGYDTFVASYDNAGSRRWVRQLSQPTEDYGTGIAADGVGNVYVAGTVDGTMPGSPDPGAGNYDVFIVSYDRSGARRWLHQLGSASWEEGGGVDVDDAGNVYVAGLTNGNLPGASGGDARFFGAFVASYDREGVRRWVNQPDALLDIAGGGIDPICGWAATVDAIGNLYVAGCAWGVAPGSPDPSAGHKDVFVARLASAWLRVQVQVHWSASESARLGQLAAFYGYDSAQIAKVGVYAVAFILGLVPSAVPTPVELEPPGVATTQTFVWESHELPILDSVKRRFALGDEDAHRFAFMLLDYLAAVQGH